MQRLIPFFNAFYYSFPVQLVLNNLKRNHVMLLGWIVLYAMATGNFGKYLGIPYLFLDPEYLNEVNFTSFFIIGATLAGFTTAYHITSYITDGHRFSFVGALAKPFTKFSVNNSVIPILFLIIYLRQIIVFQVNNQSLTNKELFYCVSGLLIGFGAMTAIFFVYFILTNKDIFKYVVCRLDEKIKQNVRVTRASAMKKLDIARKKQVRVDNYLDHNLRLKKVDDSNFYDRETVLQVFDQNHFNLVVIEFFIFVFVLVLGIFKDNPLFQLPAAASFIIFLTIFVMLSGAFSYWFGGWAVTTALAFFLIFNYLVGEDYFKVRDKAFGLNYTLEPVEYSVDKLKSLNDTATIAKDRAITLKALEAWRSKFDENEKPKMVFINVSGGGKRAALWALTVLQTADEQTNGGLMKNTMLITGASGGIIGASYYRELKLREKLGEETDPYDPLHRKSISADNLNPLIFSFLANDIFVGFTKYEYSGLKYVRDRGYTFDEELNGITDKLMDKSISAYHDPEQKSIIPMMILSPIITNDGRKLYIASQPVSYMNFEIAAFPEYPSNKISGVDFHRLFENHGAANLRFLSALRMSATFPYITPNTALPTDPAIEIMDAGVSDNFGISNTIRFIYSFKEWIAENTGGIIIISIRDSPKLGTISPKIGESIIDNLTQPISNVYNNLENFQDINNDALIGQTRSWFEGTIDRIDIQYQVENYVPILQKMDSLRQNNARASLSWRLTQREKAGIENNIYSEKNKEALSTLKILIEN